MSAGDGNNFSRSSELVCCLRKAVLNFKLLFTKWSSPVQTFTQVLRIWDMKGHIKIQNPIIKVKYSFVQIDRTRKIS